MVQPRTILDHLFPPDIKNESGIGNGNGTGRCTEISTGTGIVINVDSGTGNGTGIRICTKFAIEAELGTRIIVPHI